MTFIKCLLWDIFLINLCCAIVKEEKYTKVYCISDQVLHALKKTSMLQCSGVCIMDQKCNSFSYDEVEGNCTTYSEAISQKSAPGVTSVVYFSQNIDCGEPPAIPGMTLLPGSTKVGDIRRYSCPTDMLPPQTEVTCHLNCTWSHTPSGCRHIESCLDVKMCNRSYGDGTYKVFPSALGGNNIHVYCHAMNTSEPRAYITLFEENHSRNDYSKRKQSLPLECQYKDRVGDATATFNKISVNLTDMSVDCYDFTFADTCQESTREIPGFGEARACSLPYPLKPWYNCIPPGFFIINMNGTGLAVDTNVIWEFRGQGVTGHDTLTRSTDGLKITANVDGWCSRVVPNVTMYLIHDSGFEVWGSATKTVCGSP